MPYLPKDFPLFSKVPKNIVDARLEKLQSYIENIQNRLHIDINALNYSPKTLIEIVERVEKRRVYFHIYHGIPMGELNEAALYCFWITKLCPFFCTGKPTNILNAKIALEVFINMTYFYARHSGKTINVSEEFLKSLRYSLIFRDITKEALMTLAESLII